MEMDMEDAAPALAVVDARFCLSDAASLTAATTPSTPGKDFAVTDAATGALVLRVDGVLFSLRRRCVLVDADRRPVLTVQGSVGHPSTPSAPPSSFFSPCIYPRADFLLLVGVAQALLLNTRWKVFRGDSTSRCDRLFTVTKPSVNPLHKSTKVSVFLASNNAEQACDFRVSGSYHDGACVVSLGDSDTVIARIDRRVSVVSALLGKNTYAVTVNPGIDYAFIVALVVILDDMY
jgi:uncharacterized protein YxjI